MNNNQKRERTGAQIDIFFLLNQRKILTKKEFLAVLPRASYLSYTHTFYKRKFNKIFATCSDSEWFRKRYVNKEVFSNGEVVGRFRSFLEEGIKSCDERVFNYYTSNILIKNVPEKMSSEDLEDLGRKCLYFKDFSTYQLEQRKSFGRVGVISIDGDCSEALKFMESMVDKSLRITFEVVLFEGVSIRKCNLKGMNELEVAKRVFVMLCKKYNIFEEKNETQDNHSFLEFFDMKARDSGDALNFYIVALRKVFLFCLYCYKQYDTIYDMRILCGDWHISSEEVEENEDFKRVFSRKHEIYMECKDFGFFKTRNENSELDGFVLRKDTDRFKCDCCIKVFSTADFAKSHVKNKHPEVIEKIKAKINAFNHFADNLDFFMTSCLAGIDDFHLPAFLNLDEKVEGIRYMDKVFSGNIAIKRDELL